jgi:hypothetical protein
MFSGGFATFGRPGQTVVAPGDVVYLVFSAQVGAQPDFTLAPTPEEAGSFALVCVRYTGIDRSNLTQTRLVYRQYVSPRLIDAVVTISDIEEA